MRGKSQIENSKLDVPGAGTYQHKDIVGNESPGKTMGEKLRMKPKDGVLGPGPGGYDMDKQKSNDVKYSMGKKLEDKREKF